MIQRDSLIRITGDVVGRLCALPLLRLVNAIGLIIGRRAEVAFWPAAIGVGYDGGASDDERQQRAE